MLATMEMYPGGAGAHPDIVYRNSQTYVRSKVQGIFYSKYKAGDKVSVKFVRDEKVSSKTIKLERLN